MKIPAITIDKILKDACPDLQIGALLIRVRVAPAGPDLLQEIQKVTTERSAAMAVEEIAKIPALSATRLAYKTLGKDPSRYRPSAEALLRRVVKGKGLYQVNNVVDVLNMVSVNSGFSIGGFDFDKISGDLQAGRGVAGEPYEAIGRGVLNIEGLPVLRDAIGAFGTPTSDCTRTMVVKDTTTFLAVILDFSKGDELEKALEEMEKLLVKYASGEMIERKIFV
ncbi:MAG: phenylalanine--tRNA ligase beta subunit-related protein [Bacteroidota bacterium]